MRRSMVHSVGCLMKKVQECVNIYHFVSYPSDNDTKIYYLRNSKEYIFSHKKLKGNNYFEIYQ